jgi:hypothetical protein
MEVLTLERCVFGCCHFVAGAAVSGEGYRAALRVHPRSYPAIRPFGRNAVAERIVACRKIEVWTGSDRR